MNMYRALQKIVLASFLLFPMAAGAVSPQSGAAMQNHQRKVAPGFNELQDLTGCDFTPANGGMQIITVRNQDKDFAQKWEKGDTIISIDRARTTDVNSMINASQNVKGRVAEVVGIDHRSGQIYTITVSF